MIKYNFKMLLKRTVLNRFKSVAVLQKNQDNTSCKRREYAD